MSLLGRTEPLSVYGPPELEEILTLQLRVAATTLRFQLQFTLCCRMPPACSSAIKTWK